MKIARELRIHVVYDVDGEDGSQADVDRALKANLEEIANHAASNGMFTGELATTVDTWSMEIIDHVASAPTWSREDDAQAAKEGWNVFSIDDGRMEIQRIDECDAFETDDAALAFIRERAAGGSALHQKALDLDRGAQQGLAENDAPPVEFRVRWEIDLDAASPRDAAERAWDVQKDPQTLPPVFDVVDRRSGVVHSIDLEDTQKKPRSRNSMTM